jgi:hypothetical protein
VDRVAGLALLEGLPGILEGLLLRAVAARGAGDDEPVAALGTVVDLGRRFELLDRLDEKRRLRVALRGVGDASDDVNLIGFPGR